MSDSHTLPQRFKLSKLDSSDALGAQNGQEVIKEANNKLQTMEKAFETILRCIGEDPERPGLVKTPTRAAKAFMYFTKAMRRPLMVTKAICLPGGVSNPGYYHNAIVSKV